ncbi:hypothetical protein LJR296_008047 [Cupriavidus necator]
MGFALFAREGRRVALTSEGRNFLEQARPVIEGAGGLEERARLFAGGRTFVLRVGAAPSTIERVLPLVRHFRRSGRTWRSRLLRTAAALC